MVFKILKYNITLILLIIFRAKSNLQNHLKNDHLITINTNLRNEISVFEIIKIENQRFTPKYVNVDFYWDKYQVSDIYKEVCYFYKFQNTQKISENKLKNEYSCSMKRMNLFQAAFSKDPINLKEINGEMLKLSKRLLIFFDYEYDPSRPNHSSNNDIDIWRDTHYNKLKLTNLIVPGKGSSRLYIKTETDSAFVGNYFGHLKIKYEDKVELKRVKLSIGPPPLNVFITKETQTLESDDKIIIIDLKLRNHLIFRNLNIFVKPMLKGLEENLCSIRNKFLVKSQIIEIKPGELENIQVKCIMGRLRPESIKELLIIQINSFWKNSSRYTTTYTYNEMLKQEEKFNRGLFLSDFILDDPISEEYFNFNMILYQRDLMKHLKDNNKESISFEDSFKEDFHPFQYWITLDLLQISEEILSLKDIKILIKIDNSPSEFLRVTFYDKNIEKAYELDSVTQTNSLLFFKINLEFSPKTWVNNIFLSKENGKLQIPIKVLLFEKNKNIYEERNFLEKTWIFNLDIESKFEEYIIRNNIIKNKNGQFRLIVNNLDQNINMNMLSIKNSDKKSEKTEIRLLKSKNKSFILISKVLALKIRKYEVVNLMLNFKGLIDRKILELKQAKSAKSNSIEDLPYFLELGNNKRLQLATLANCGIVEMSKNEVDFGIVPVSLFGNPKLIQKIEVKIKRFKTKTKCSKKFSVGFRLSSNFNLKLIRKNNPYPSSNTVYTKIVGKDTKLVKEYIYDFLIEDSEVFLIFIEPNFDISINVEHKKSANISTLLEVYTPLTMRRELKYEQIDIWRDSMLENEFLKRNLFFTEFIKIACIIRSLHISAGSPHIRSALHSEIMSQELVKNGKLPISLFLIEVKNEEEFPVQYSLQRDVSLWNKQEKSTKEYFTENYTFYISYDSDGKNKLKKRINEFEKQFSVFENKTFFENVSERTELFDNLAFNFPFKNLYLMNVIMVLRLGMVCIYNGEIFSHKNSFCVKLLPIEIAEKLENLKISMGHLRLNIWQVTIRFSLNIGADFVTGLKLYETGRIDWYFYGLDGSFVDNPEVFEKFIPILVSNMDLESAFVLREIVEFEKIKNLVRISTVPWLEVSNEVPRTGYLLPKENRLISILVHNQIITSSSIYSKIKELKCSYNLVFKGITDIGETLDGSDDSFSRMLLENDQELRQESIGMKSLFSLDWTIPNVINDLGYGGGFVKKITLINPPISKIGEDLSALEYVQFIVEIQNPIICTKKESGTYQDENENQSDFFRTDDTEQEFEEYGSDETNQLKDKFCTPFNNLEIVKGFRVIWYPYNNFSPTNYKSVEILIEDVPKYDFKTSSYSLKSSKEKESEESLEVSRIFTDYIKESGSEDSDYAYLLKINYNFVLNQQYTFKFAITHHKNIKNSVFIPPFGFNITAQNHSIRWLRSLSSIESDISQTLLIKNFAKKICKGDINILSDNSLVLKWDKEFLNIISTFSVSYFEVDIIDQMEEEWQVKELMSDLITEEKTTHSTNKKLIFITNPQKTQEGISKFFSEDINNETRLFIKIPGLPSSLKLKIVVEIEDYNSEKFQCISKAFQTKDGVPTEPKDFQFIPLTINSVKLSWDIPKSEGGSQILDYLINLSPELVNSPNEYKIGNITIISDKLMVILDQIFPMVTYKATVQARNKFGLGRPSTINHVTPRSINSCINIDNYKLIINESSKRQISWKAENFEKIDLKTVLVYVYCNIRDGTKSQFFLIELLKALNVCRMDGTKAFCTWIEEECMVNLRCDSYSIKMINKTDKSGNEDFLCINELGTQKPRRLKGDFNNDITLDHTVKVYHISSMDEINNIGVKREKIYYPKGYNPEWENGLIKTIMKINLLGQNTSQIEIEVNYLYETENLEEIMLNGTVGNVWYKKYYYDLKQEKAIQSLGNMKNWSIFEEENYLAINNHKIGQLEQIELMVLNLIPEMTVMISVRELDRSNTEISVSRHVLRIPNKFKKIELTNRKLLSSGILKVELDNHFVTQKELSDKKNRIGSNWRYLNEREKGSKNELKLNMNTDLESIGSDLSNSLFISSKLVIDGWPEDFERRLFEEVEITINSGYLRFNNNSKEISGPVKNYKPISELKIYNQSKSQEEISNLFDGNPETGIYFYNNNSSDLFTSGIENVINEEYFPHISLSFNPPICILYAKLYWEGNRSPVSTMVSVGLRSKNVSKPRIRNYNPIVHECFHSPIYGNKSYTQERIDTIQIIPPEEMVNTYLTNPSNRYSYTHNFTLSFAGSCADSGIKETKDEVILSIKEIEIIPCISNDLVLSYSNPLSETNMSLVNSQYILRKSQLEEKYLEIQNIILDNLRKETKGDKTDLNLRNISIKYKKPINETKIYLDLNTILSEESKLRSTHIPSIRLLIQDNIKEEESLRSPKNHRRLAEHRNVSELSFIVGYILHLWFNLTIVFFWNLIYIFKKLN
ncbi:extracellular protein [Cryptosporidium ubiquitum]|uniref:Extracellular protein n=1 Tax=Cryptosporidium ubiquitum TaxID=857276 RepID=A0A1J4MBU2_9CRYT|nr:extracellular protein [Cryptosporidium ubiquitum]OII71696.1 extracellular protein [Cryptosporidium ubiquitum]